MSAAPTRISNTHTQQERAAFSFRARFLFFPSASTGPSPAPAQRRLEAELRCSLPGACALTGQPARCSTHWTPSRLMAPRRSRRSSRLVAWRDTASAAGVVQGKQPCAVTAPRPSSPTPAPRAPSLRADSARLAAALGLAAVVLGLAGRGGG